MHVLLALVLGGLWQLGSPPGPEERPLDQALALVDAGRASPALRQELRTLRPGLALTEERERAVRSFLSIAGNAAGLKVLGLRFEPGIPSEGRVPVVAALDALGDPFRLPILLESVHRQQALGVVERLSVQVAEPGGTARMQVRVRFQRPVPADPAWIEARLSELAPDAQGTRQTLELALEVATWRAFQQSSLADARRAREIRSRLLVGLAVPLQQVRTDGGRLLWTPEDGVTISAGQVQAP